jgi:AbrB family transcriptional regulator (stage V sporulation protein T)
VSGGSKKEFLEKYVSTDLKNVMDKCGVHTACRKDANFVPILEEDNPNAYNNEFIAPILAEGDVQGAIVFLSTDKMMGEVEKKLAQTAAGFLGKQIEQ